MTPEALQSDLGGQPPTKLEGLPEMEQARWRQSRDFAAQRALTYDELSGLLAAAGRDYAAGLIETLLRLIDCEEHFVRSTRSQGRVAIQNAYLSILGASTPRAMEPHLGAERLWAMGWWPRFAILTPQVTKPAWAQPTTDGPPSEDLPRPLRNLYQRLPTPTWPEPAKYRAVTLGPGVFDAWQIYNKAVSYDLITDDLDERLKGTYGRLPTQVMKVAIIIAAFDWAQNDEPSAPEIEPRHLHRAIQIVEAWRASAHRALDQAAVADENVLHDRVLRQVRRHGLGGASLKEIAEGMRDVPRTRLRVAVDEAVATGELDKIDAGSGPKGGRPTVRYRIALR